MALWVWPPVGLYDGRHANRNWLQELPEPVSWRTWGTWLDLHPDTARGLGLEDGDWAALATMAGEIEAPVRVTPEVAPDTVAVPLGQGHTSLGRNAVPRGANGFRLLAGPAVTASSAGPFGQAALRKAKRPATQVHPPVTVTSSQDQHDRELLRWTTPAGGRNSHAPEHFSLPLPEGYDPARDVYPGHKHAGHRWAMVVDLARCIGCGACSVACQAENNIPSIGPVELGRHRNLSWLRVVPYRHPDDPRRVGWLPLMCQHCDAAPCEPVCPVYASMHNEEGLNAQIYNRCVGTRYCNNNCPYKVRRFNWFDYSETAFVPPLDWQLNPDVTVRRRGVMEKCTFCVQRIREAEYRARIEGNRMLRDGEVQPACVQSCPARVFAFGDLHDPASEVSRLFRTDPRRYQLLGELNTKPGVAYLRRLDRG